MKQSFVLFVLTIFCINAKAKNNFSPFHTLNDTMPGYKIFPDSNSLKSIILGLNPGNKFLFQNEKGNVFALGPDHMFCLTPIELQKMPVQKNNVLPFMPNQIPQAKKIPLTGKSF